MTDLQPIDLHWHGEQRGGSRRAWDSGRQASNNDPRQAAVLEERNRIARELHDTLASGLAAIRVQLELARGEQGLPPRSAKALDLAYQLAGENLIETRRSIAVLLSAEPTLMASLSSVVEAVRRLSDGKVIATLRPVPTPPREVAHELLRIAQEAMINAARHARARTIRVTLKPAPGGGMRLSVIDDGRGFDPDQTTSGFGLACLRDRAAAIQAKLSIVSAPGAGTRVAVAWAP
jgi:signal transduction histidine kinase